MNLKPGVGASQNPSGSGQPPQPKTNAPPVVGATDRANQQAGLAACRPQTHYRLALLERQAKMYKLTQEQQVSVISALLEGNSIRSIERMTGIHRDTICRLLVRVGEHCEHIMHHKLRGLTLTKIECDEIWTYVAKKHKQVRDDDPPQVGDQWVFVAMDADTKLIPCYTVGKRSEYTTHRFMWDLAHRIDNRFQLTTDRYTFYRRAVPRAFGDDVDFAQVTKLYGDYGQHDAATKYSPCPIVEVITKVRSGNPDPHEVSRSKLGHYPES